jgi:hypothetical protein
MSLIENLDRDMASACIGGLMLLPQFHANVLRLQMCSHLVVAFSRGDQSLTRDVLDRLLNQSLREIVGPEEKAPRDVFTANVVTAEGNRRILVSGWETMDYWFKTSYLLLNQWPKMSRS